MAARPSRIAAPGPGQGPGPVQKKGGRTKPSAAGKGKAAVARLREFGELRFDYFSACKHDLINPPTNCPLCKLASYTTAAFFAQEAEQRLRNREESLCNRALLRIDLMSHWDRCQTLHYVDFEGNKCAQVYFSKSFLEALWSHEELVVKYASLPIEFSYLERVLQRRNRMFEAGNLAALFIQARVRRFLVQRRIRRMLLNRFEYVAATKHKGEFYVDTVKLRKLARYPMLLRNEPPGTPRTILRRITYENNIHLKRISAFKDSVMKQQEEGSGQSYEGEEALVQFYKQIVVTRDIVALAMQRLRKIITEESSVVPSDMAVWVLPAAPAPPPRQIGLSLALQSLPQLSTSLPAKEDSKSRPKTPGLKSAGDSAPQISPINRALQQLDCAIYEALCCRTPEDVMHKILQPEFLPLYASILNITQDDFNIWNGDVEFQRSTGSQATIASAASGMTAVPAETITEVSSSEGEPTPAAPAVPTVPAAWEVLPFGLQIRPYVPRQPAGYFRLFFYEEEFIAVCSASPWSYFPELFKNKDQVLNSIRKFAVLPTTRAFVHDYMLQSVASKGTRGGGPTAPTPAAVPAPVGTSKSTNDGRRITIANPKGGVPKTLPPPAPVARDPGTLFAPPDHLVFPRHCIEDKDVRTPALLHQLSDPQVVSLKEKYRFVSKLSVFAERYKRAQANESRRAVRSKQSSRPATQGTTKQANPAAASGAASVSSGSTATTAVPNLLGMRRNRTEGLLVNMNVLLDSMLAQGQLKGVAVHDLVAPPLSETAAAFVPSSRHPYVTSLHANSVSVNANIKGRIMQPETLPERKQSVHLLVLDVYVNLPAPRLPANKPGRGAFYGDDSAGDSSSSLSTVGSRGAPMPTSPATSPPFSVELHQVVGVFNCSSDKQPPNLDTGMFAYEYFYRICKDRTAMQALTITHKTPHVSGNVESDRMSVGSGTSSSTQGGANTGVKDRGWTAVNPQTGVCVGKALLPTGREFQCIILGAPPSTDYLEQILPKKVQCWLGWVKEEKS